MSPRSARAVVALILSAVLMAGSGFAAEIVMRDGTVYSGVTIIRQDAAAVECYSKFGKITLPTPTIAQIDGVPMEQIPVNTLPYASGPAATPPLATPKPRLMPPAVPRKGVDATAISPTVQGTPHPFVKPTPSLAPRPARPVIASPTPASPTPAPSPASGFLASLLDPSQWNLSWQDFAVPFFCAAWMVSILRVRRDGRETPGRAARLWLLAAIFLPIVGYLLHEAVRLWQRHRVVRQAAEESLHEFIFLDANHQPVMIEASAADSGLENAKGVLQAAIYDRASDVHIEPGGMEYRVRFRIDGVLHPRLSFPSEKGLRMISALKNVAQLDISERRKAQDGRFGGRAGNREVDFRAATTPTVHGEKLVLRILDQKSGVRGLADLGMTPKMMERFAEVITFRSGMILATGPTGSGKTSSLYAALTQLDAVRLNIVTIEDPVEYELAGATQIPVNVKAGVTYESGLRSILRQDPDVILVGEMRDLEAAQIALRSALTGHLVFSSLHSRDAVGTIHRLEEMGIERHLLASALLVVLSQRLVRVLCPNCRRPFACKGNELAEIGIELPPGETLYQEGGCKRCEGSGYVGRTGIFEMLILNEGMRQEINDGIPEDAFTRSARAGGYREYREDGAEKVLLGITSVDEVLKAI